MKNAKIKLHARTLLQLVTPGTIYEHFEEQQNHLIQRGKITRRIAKRKLQSYAADCHKSFRQQMRMAQTPRDLNLLERALLQELSPNRTGFLKADWKGNRRATIAALHESYDE
jgi:hypothetical protein